MKRRVLRHSYMGKIQQNISTGLSGGHWEVVESVLALSWFGWVSFVPFARSTDRTFRFSLTVICFLLLELCGDSETKRRWGHCIEVSF